jgi:hypothetical protein
MIKKVGNSYEVVAKSGKLMGRFATQAAAKKRLRQIEFFKRNKKGA